MAFKITILKINVSELTLPYNLSPCSLLFDFFSCFFFFQVGPLAHLLTVELQFIKRTNLGLISAAAPFLRLYILGSDLAEEGRWMSSGQWESQEVAFLPWHFFPYIFLKKRALDFLVSFLFFKFLSLKLWLHRDLKCVSYLAYCFLPNSRKGNNIFKHLPSPTKMLQFERVPVKACVGNLILNARVLGDGSNERLHSH